MAGIDEKVDVEHVGHVEHAALEGKENNIQHSELLVDNDLMNHAFAAENAEHEITAWQAVKTHPMACFWAFLMCFTIVSLLAHSMKTFICRAIA